jgi:hypothetical protein
MPRGALSRASKARCTAKAFTEMTANASPRITIAIGIAVEAVFAVEVEGAEVVAEVEVAEEVEVEAEVKEVFEVIS